MPARPCSASPRARCSPRYSRPSGWARATRSSRCWRAGAAPELLAAATRAHPRAVDPARAAAPAERRGNGVAQARYTLLAPAAGVIAESGRAGMAVSPGMTLFRIAQPGEGLGGGRGAEAQALRPHARPEGDGRAAGRSEPQPRWHAAGDPAAGGERRRRARCRRAELDNKAGTHARPACLLRLQIAGASGAPGGARRGGLIRTGTRRGHRAQGSTAASSRSRSSSAPSRRDARSHRGAQRRRAGRRQRPVLVDPRRACALGAGQNSQPRRLHRQHRRRRRPPTWRKARSRASSPTASPSPTARCPSSSGRA